ncbi:Hypothetical_protein [Hexamita inflata]|uniref:Hypothetical_protein n=1 Tax=Hexamita inflata TaxID=28002 RepID=A0ABP1IKP8_9EUKA
MDQYSIQTKQELGFMIENCEECINTISTLRKIDWVRNCFYKILLRDITTLNLKLISTKSEFDVLNGKLYEFMQDLQSFNSKLVEISQKIIEGKKQVTDEIIILNYGVMIDYLQAIQGSIQVIRNILASQNKKSQLIQAPAQQSLQLSQSQLNTQFSSNQASPQVLDLQIQPQLNASVRSRSNSFNTQVQEPIQKGLHLPEEPVQNSIGSDIQIQKESRKITVKSSKMQTTPTLQKDLQTKAAYSNAIQQVNNSGANPDFKIKINSSQKQLIKSPEKQTEEIHKSQQEPEQLANRVLQLEQDVKNLQLQLALEKEARKDLQMQINQLKHNLVVE